MAQKRRNPVASSLRAGQFKPKIISARKGKKAIYSRKLKIKIEPISTSWPEAGFFKWVFTHSPGKGVIMVSLSRASLAATRNLQGFPALVLNADFRPVSCLPLSVMGWQDALSNAMAGQVIVVAEHEMEAHSPSMTVRLPAVIALKVYVPRRETPPPSRRNVIVLRDKCSCAYCGGTFHESVLTLDHVIPKSKGGPHRWENLVSACSDCNGRKADRTPDQAKMPLLWRPWQPSMDELARADYFLQQRRFHESWREFLPFAA